MSDLQYNLPEGYLLINRNKVKFASKGDFYLRTINAINTEFCSNLNNWKEIWENDSVNTWNYSTFLFIRKINKHYTREEMIMNVKNHSKEFVTRNVPSPTQENYTRFENAFLKEWLEKNPEKNKNQKELDLK
jgi:hypothetical protein